MDIQAYFKGGNTIQKLLVAPKDKDTKTQKSEVIYSSKYDMDECDEQYIRESARTFRERCKEHPWAPSPIYDHVNITVHQTSVNKVTIMGRESHNLTRTTKEAMYIRVNDPSPKETLEGTSCHTYGMMSCSAPQTSSSSNSNITCGFSEPFAHITRWIRDRGYTQ